MPDLPAGPHLCLTGAPGDDASPRAAAPRRSHAVGQVVWHELRTTDVARARSFYAALFGWVVRPVWAHPDDRAVLHLAGTAVAAVGPLERSDGDSSHWVPFVAVPDVEECCFRAPELRGAVYHQSSAERYGIGPAAVLEDPQGAIWAAVGSGSAGAVEVGGASPMPWAEQRPTGHRGPSYRAVACQPVGYRPPGYYGPPGHRPQGYRSPGQGASAAPSPATAVTAPAMRAEGPAGTAAPSRAGRIERTLLITPDAEDARQFYGTLLGWRFPEAGEGRASGGVLGASWLARAGACEVAAVVDSTLAMRARIPRPSWLPCVSVAALGASLEAAWTAGATVLLGDSHVPALGRLGLVRDPTGAVLALVEPARGAVAGTGASGGGPE